MKNQKKDNEKTDLTPRKEIRLRYYEANVELIKSIAWPLIAVIVIIWLFKPLSAILNIIPERISKLSVGDISIELQQAASDKGLADLGKTIGTLSSKALEILLRTGNSPHSLMGRNDTNANVYFLPNEETMSALYELESKKLLLFKTPIKDYLLRIENIGLKATDNFSDETIEYESSTNLSPEEIKFIKDQQYALTELGKEAYNLIIEVVSNALAK